MAADRGAPQSIDAYIAGFAPEVRGLLEQIRRTIQIAVPEATEAIKYQIPTFVLHGNLVHFAAYPGHIGLYPAPREAPEFRHELEAYAGGKGTVRFPLDQPIPFDLVTRIARHLAARNVARAAAKSKPRAR